jgi:hypothetical protein
MIEIFNMYCPHKPNDPVALSIGHGNEKMGTDMPSCELAATALALVIGACLAHPSPAEAEQFASQSTGQPVSDAGNVKPVETRERQDQMDTAEALQEAKETDRLMRWLNESALLTGADERTRVRSIRFR